MCCMGYKNVQELAPPHKRSKCNIIQIQMRKIPFFFIGYLQNINF